MTGTDADGPLEAHAGADAPLGGGEPAAPTPAPRLLVPPGRVRAALEVLLCSGFPTQVLVAGLLRIGGLEPVDAAGRLSAPFVITLSLVDAALLVTLIVWLLRLGGERPRDVFVGARPPVREAVAGVAFLPVVFLLVVVVLSLVRRVAPWLHNVPENPLTAMLQTPLGAAVFLLTVIVAGGVREELQRAFLLHRFSTHLGGPAVGLVVTSVAFGLGHTVQGWDAAIVTGALGAAWGLLYLRRRSAVAAIVSHALFNSTEVLRATMFA